MFLCPAFAELQTDMTDLTADLESSGIPTLDHKNYIMKVFFPGVSDHPILNDPKVRRYLDRYCSLKFHNPSSVRPVWYKIKPNFTFVLLFGLNFWIPGGVFTENNTVFDVWYMMLCFQIGLLIPNLYLTLTYLLRMKYLLGLFYWL